jgi:hypothetical protein
MNDLVVGARYCQKGGLVRVDKSVHDFGAKVGGNGQLGKDQRQKWDVLNRRDERLKGV